MEARGEIKRGKAAGGDEMEKECLKLGGEGVKEKM